jgi:hypothetical protein
MAMEEEEQPRKKGVSRNKAFLSASLAYMLTQSAGSRGGKRSVTHLSKAQLERKRANDREAQRNIRQRTKEHIESLEKKVKELEQGNHQSSSMERVLKRNKELEEEIEKLRAQVAARQIPAASTQTPPQIPEELLVPQKDQLEWMGEAASPPGTWSGAVPSHGPTSSTNTDLPVSAYASNDAQTVHAYPPVATPIGYDDETSQQLYTPNSAPVWEDPLVLGTRTTQSVAKPVTAWAPFPPAFSGPSRFADLQKSGFNNLVNTPPGYNTTCWQSQPSTYAWQISTKIKAPVTYVDQLMFSVIHSQRHLAMTANLTGEDLIGPSFPSVHLLFNQPGPIDKKPSSLTEVMERYSAVLSNRGFQLIPEKLASFMCMYRFVQWQINPNYDTYQALHEWQAPRPSQLTISHPAWMDLPPWGKFRDKVIENQDKYDNPEFQNDYASNLSVNFPHDPMKALIFENGQIMVSKVMDRHLSDISNMSMKRLFADKYPEFRDACRFDEAAS